MILAKPGDYCYYKVITSYPNQLEKVCSFHNDLYTRSVHGSLLAPITFRRIDKNTYYVYCAWQTYLFGIIPGFKWIPFLVYTAALRISLKVKGKLKCKFSIMSANKAAWFEVTRGLK